MADKVIKYMSQEWIDQLNEELKKSGYLTIPGKVDSLYLKKRYFPSEEKMQIDDGG